ncbi:MAG: hypothetical protein M1308_13315 [Actinobacteria bacterium]|nr:hypothetical protein [Actinomycetota bacterium]
MEKLEQKMTTKLIHYLKSDICPLGTCAIEVKIMRGNTFRLNQIAEHQINALHLTKHHQIVWKIPDAGFSNPYDIIKISEQEAYVAIIKDKQVFFIDIDKIMAEKRKSLKILDIINLANFSINLR